MVFERSRYNPILTREWIQSDHPRLQDVSSVFNPGATWVNGAVQLLLRVQNRGRETYLVHAESSDGIQFSVSRNAVELVGFEAIEGTIYHVYDPRITVVDSTIYVVVALDMDGICRLAITKTEDFSSLEFISLIAEGDTRNGVLFPSKFDNDFLLLDRPNMSSVENDPGSGEEIWLNRSADLLEWEQVSRIANGRPHYWDERIGAGPPPLLTDVGWLLIYHGVATHFASSNIYQAGVMLLDKNDPSKLIARGSLNILEPRELYEMVGQVQNVVFPSGALVLGKESGDILQAEDEILLYYGSADSCTAMAMGTVGDLLDACNI